LREDGRPSALLELIDGWMDVLVSARATHAAIPSDVRARLDAEGDYAAESAAARQVAGMLSSATREALIEQLELGRDELVGLLPRLAAVEAKVTNLDDGLRSLQRLIRERIAESEARTAVLASVGAALQALSGGDFDHLDEVIEIDDALLAAASIPDGDGLAVEGDEAALDDR
jgi:hypothetical protein